MVDRSPEPPQLNTVDYDDIDDLLEIKMVFRQQQEAATRLVASRPFN